MAGILAMAPPAGIKRTKKKPAMTPVQ